MPSPNSKSILVFLAVSTLFSALTSCQERHETDPIFSKEEFITSFVFDTLGTWEERPSGGFFSGTIVMKDPITYGQYCYYLKETGISFIANDSLVSSDYGPVIKSGLSSHPYTFPSYKKALVFQEWLNHTYAKAIQKGNSTNLLIPNKHVVDDYSGYIKSWDATEKIEQNEKPNHLKLIVSLGYMGRSSGQEF